MLNSTKGASFRVSLMTICILIAVLMVGVALSLQYYFSKKIAMNASQGFSKQIALQLEYSIARLDEAAENTTSLLAQYSALIKNGELSEGSEKILADLLAKNKDFLNIYFGLENGDFYNLINLQSTGHIRARLQAAPEDRYVRVQIFNGVDGRIKKVDYLDEYLNVRLSVTEDSNYDPRPRPWFKNATESETHKSKPYLFQQLQTTGQSYSRILKGSRHVVAVDITLATVSRYINEIIGNSEYKTNTQLFIFDDKGEVLISNTENGVIERLPSKPVLLNEAQKSLISELGTITVSNDNSWAPFDFAISGQPKGYAPELITFLSEKLGLSVNFLSGHSWDELIQLYHAGKIDVLQPLFKTPKNQDWGFFSDSILKVPLGLAIREGISSISSLKDLNGKRLALAAGHSVFPLLRLHYPEITLIEYKTVHEALAAALEGNADAVLDSHTILTYTAQMRFLDGLRIVDIGDGKNLGFENNLRLLTKDQELTDLLNFALQNLTADEKDYLSKRWLNFEKINHEINESTTVPYKPLITYASQPEQYGKTFEKTFEGGRYLVYINPTTLGAPVNTYMALLFPTKEAYAKGLKNVATSIVITCLILLLMIPLIWLIATPIVKSIQRLTDDNEKIKDRRYDQLEPRSSFIREINDVFISLRKMARAIQGYEKKQEELLDSFIVLIAQAIDDKSPYTASHCNRVPELGTMLANVASENDTPYFKDFKLDTEEKQREFKLAAWLHDCGKISTPEHIVDKGTKLECIYNRIHEIRMRFEVLWRDAIIDYHINVAQNPLEKETLLKKLTKEQVQLKDEFEFIASCNQGGELMADDKIERLMEISQRAWQRHFPNNLGLSPLEEMEVDMSRQDLPATEKLLADKETHITHRDRPISYEPHLEVKLDVPTYKANLGEIYNLSISRGTLTVEDRFIINEHTIGTIKMLDSIPFPEELANVSRYASTHHETLKGTGYPRRLSADDLTIPERILVLADIFEALTASDRPYKKAKSLSVAVDILHKMCLDEHVDIEIFRLFLESGIYLEYAKRYLPDDKIDKVPLEKYL